MSNILTGIILWYYQDAFTSLRRNEMELFTIKCPQYWNVYRDWTQLVVKNRLLVTETLAQKCPSIMYFEMFLSTCAMKSMCSTFTFS